MTTRMMMPRSRYPGIAAVLPTLAVLAGCGDAAAGEGADGFEVALAEVRDLSIRVEASGDIEPLRLIEVKSNAGGEILRLHFDTGDDVAQDALLAEINPRDVRNSLAQAEADVEVARASLATRDAQLRRATELWEAQIVTLQEFESAELDVTNARAQLVKAETNLELAEERMNDITIRAPISGTVVQKQVEAGQIIASATGNVSGGTTLLMMADLSEMQVRTLVDQTDIGLVQVGQEAEVTVDAYPNRTFRGSVTKIEPLATESQNVTMFPVLIRLSNPERLLLPGMNADVGIAVQEQRNAVSVPNSAVLGVPDAAAAATVVGVSEEDLSAAMRDAGLGGGIVMAGAGSGGGMVIRGTPPQLEGECGVLLQRARDDGPAALSDSDRAELMGCREQIGGAVGGGGMTAMGAPPQLEGECGELLRSATEGSPAALSEADRARLTACREDRGGSPSVGAQGAAPSPDDERPGVLFVRTPTGIEPRFVRLGVNDFDYTQIVEGIEPGEEVVLVSLAQLQQQQDQMTDMIRQRAGGLPGAGGPGMGGAVRVGGGGGGAVIVR